MSGGQNVVDLTGQLFGRLVVLSRYPRSRYSREKSARWLCKCDCGNEKIATSIMLKRHKVRSCGCLRFKNADKQRLISFYIKNGFAATTPLALELGIHPKSVSRMARAAGYHQRFPTPKVTKKARGEDPRWKWAIERGFVVA